MGEYTKVCEQMERDQTRREETKRNETKRNETRRDEMGRGWSKIRRQERLERAKRALIEQGTYIGRIAAAPRDPLFSELRASVYLASCNLSHARSLLQDQPQLTVVMHPRILSDIYDRKRFWCGTILRYVYKNPTGMHKRVPGQSETTTSKPQFHNHPSFFHRAANAKARQVFTRVTQQWTTW
jgi:hypothetical protein